MALTPAEVVVTGSGEPVTVVAHGLGGSAADTRPLGSGVSGTRVFPAARGHGGTPLGAEPITYDLLGRDLEQVSAAHGATRAIGVSMGAGALLSLLAREPARFERTVLFLPAAVDVVRDDAAVRRVAALGDALDAADEVSVAALVAAEVPPDLAVQAAPWVRARTQFLLGSPGVGQVARALAGATPVASRVVLGAVASPVLVIAQEGDPLHPAEVARELADLLPAARLVLFDRPGAVFRERRRLRELVVGFLDA